MKKLLKNICCFALVATMLLSNVTVFAYTSDELSKIRKSEEAVVLYTVGNKDLELYVSKSKAESTTSSVVTYASTEAYKSAGATEGRRSGVKKAMDAYYETMFPKETDGLTALSKISDSTILSENKIAESDPNKQAFLDAYKENFVDAYNKAEYELSGYYFGKLKANGDLIRYSAYSPKPALKDVYAAAEKSVFSSYGVNSTDKYGSDFSSAYKKGYEITYTNEDSGSDIAYNSGKIVGYETASEIASDLKDFEDLNKEIETYKNSSEYRIVRARFTTDSGDNSNIVELNAQYDKGFNDGVLEYTSGDASETEVSEIYIKGFSDGGQVGEQVGEVYAKNNFINHSVYNVDSAYADYTSNVNFYTKYRLELLPEDYRNGFLAGIEEGFYKKYEEIYLLMQGNTATTSQFVQLPTQGDLLATYKIEADSTDLSVSFALDFGYGNFFNESFVRVYDNGRFWGHNAERYTAYSNAYIVETYNNASGYKQDYVNLKKPMYISFTHDLGENVGIYKVIGNQLRYIHTEVNHTDGKTVFSEIPVGKYYGGTYVLLADEKLPKVKDISNNWNYSGLDTYSRRGWLPTSSDGLAKPESNITRAKFAYLLERNLNTTNEIVAKPLNFADQNKFYGYDNAINYCVSKGYFTVGSDNKFRPQDTISYAEVEIVLERALGYKVSFANVDKKMQTTNFHKSKYASNKKNPITVSEAVYTLLDIFQ